MKKPMIKCLEGACEKCKLLFELYERTPKSDRDYWLMTELFVLLHGSDECKEAKMIKLNLNSKDIIEPGKIVNVSFVNSPPIINAKVLYIPHTEGDGWHLKAKEGIVYVQMFERMDLIG